MSKKPPEPPESRRKRRGRAIMIAAAMVAAETVYMRKSGYAVGLKTVVKCRDGHLFTTIWIPGASVKALRLGPVRRLQWCPVGRHFTSVQPVKVAELTDEMQETAALQHDARIP